MNSTIVITKDGVRAELPPNDPSHLARKRKNDTTPALPDKPLQNATKVLKRVSQNKGECLEAQPWTNPFDSSDVRPNRVLRCTCCNVDLADDVTSVKRHKDSQTHISNRASAKETRESLAKQQEIMRTATDPQYISQLNDFRKLRGLY